MMRLNSLSLIGIYFLAVNVIAFAGMGIDKFKAIHRLWRTPEAVLFLQALAGGVLGSLAGMLVFRHKIRKSAFRIGMPLILLLYLLLAFFLLRFSDIVFM